MILLFDATKPSVTLQNHIAKRHICRIWIVLQLCSHICLAKLIISCCYRRASTARAGQPERINFAKLMCELSCWTSIFNSQMRLFAMRVRKQMCEQWCVWGGVGVVWGVGVWIHENLCSVIGILYSVWDRTLFLSAIHIKQQATQTFTLKFCLPSLSTGRKSLHIYQNLKKIPTKTKHNLLPAYLYGLKLKTWIRAQGIHKKNIKGLKSKTWG